MAASVDAIGRTIASPQMPVAVRWTWDVTWHATSWVRLWEPWVKYGVGFIGREADRRKPLLAVGQAREAPLCNILGPVLEGSPRETGWYA